MTPEQQHGHPIEPAGRPGRGFVVSGIVLMVLAVAGAVLATLALGGSLDLDSFDRDVVLPQGSSAAVPGSLEFRVIEDIDSPERTMRVGVLLRPDTASVHNATSCTITDEFGVEVALRGGVESDTFASNRLPTDVRPFLVAKDLGPGDYTATCAVDPAADTGEPSGPSGEPSEGEAVPSGTEVTIEVGRVVTMGEVFDFAKPAFGIIAALVLGGFVGFVGLVLLVVGLVIGNRARRPPQPQW